MNVEAAASDETAQDRRDGEDSENGENGEDDDPFEPTRGGKLVAGGIALALIGALTFGGLRVFNGESTPTSERSVETEKSESGENGRNSENESNEAKSDVGALASRAVEEQTSENKNEPELRINDSAASGEGENALLGELGEVESIGEDGEDAQGLNVEAGDFGEETALAAEDGGNSENGGNNEDEKKDENVAVELSGEEASAETALDVENASALDDKDGGLDKAGDLEALGEGGAIDDAEDEADDAAIDDAVENVGEEASAREKLAGSNSATGFNEADFERANQNNDPENADESADVDWGSVASTTNPTLQSALPTLRRERKEIDVDARLALPIKSIEFPASPVAAIRILSEFTGVSIVPDLETLVLTRPSTNATLDLALRDTTAGEALEKVAELLNWEVCKEKDRILIRPSGNEPATFVEERFDVADLTTPRANKIDETRLEMFELPNNLTAEALGALIKSTVAPETWLENGGNANLTIDGTTLAISQNAQNREKARILLEGARAIRGLNAQGDASPERVIPEKLGWEKLTKKTTFAPLEPLPLQNAIEILEKAQNFQALWDDATLLEAGVGRDLSTSARVENKTLDAALREILEPLRADYIILGRNLILITETGVANDYQTVEFFSLIGENGERPTLAEARALVEEIKVAIAPESWKESVATGEKNASDMDDVGIAEEAESGKGETVATDAQVGEDASNGEGAENIGDAQNNEGAEGKTAAIWLDVESSCLIVRQSQPNQRALRRWLAVRLADSASRSEEKAN